MNRKIIGIIVSLIIVMVGLIFSLGFARQDKPATELPSTETALSAIETPATTPVSPSQIIQGPVSIEILTCTITTAGGYEVDLRLKNNGDEKRTVTVHPMNDIIVLQPLTVTRKDLAISFEDGTLSFVVDSGERFDVPVPTCVIRGGSGGGGGFLAAQEASDTEPATTLTATTPALTEPAATTGPTASPSTNEIPEFQWIGMPVIMVLLLMLLIRRK